MNSPDGDLAHVDGDQQRLRDELVVALPGVAPPRGRDDDAIDLAMSKAFLEARRVVDVAGAELAAARRTPAHLDLLTTALQRMESAHAVADVGAFVEGDILFHQAVLDAAGRIAVQVMVESAVVGAVGAVAGAGLGYAGAALIDVGAPKLSAPVGSRIVSAAVSTQITIDVLMLAVAIAVAGGVLAGALGGLRAARLHPSSALARPD